MKQRKKENEKKKNHHHKYVKSNEKIVWQKKEKIVKEGKENKVRRKMFWRVTILNMDGSKH